MNYMKQLIAAENFYEYVSNNNFPDDVIDKVKDEVTEAYNEYTKHAMELVIDAKNAQIVYRNSFQAKEDAKSKLLEAVDSELINELQDAKDAYTIAHFEEAAAYAAYKLAYTKAKA